MGHERKRGKLAALNDLLHDRDATAFSAIVGDLRALQGVRYVITLDTDTRLPRDAARELVGTLAHPLNPPRVDPGPPRVSCGSGLRPQGGSTDEQRVGHRECRTG